MKNQTVPPVQELVGAEIYSPANNSTTVKPLVSTSSLSLISEKNTNKRQRVSELISHRSNRSGLHSGPCRILPRIQTSGALLDLTRSSDPLPPLTEPSLNQNLSQEGFITPLPKRIQGQNFFLTFPRCSLPKSEILKNLQELCPTLKGALVAQETHADGGSHLHVAVFLLEKLRVSDPHFWDRLTLSESGSSKHGNYMVMKNPKKCLAYCQKEDTAPLLFGKVPTLSEPTTSKSAQAANQLISGSSLQEVMTLDPGFFLLNMQKIKAFHSYVSDIKARESLDLLTLPIVYNGTDSSTRTIVDWLNTNLFVTRSFKSPQLFISGPPNSLKTSLVLKVSKHLSMSVVPTEEEFFDSYSDDDHLVFLDEFKGQKRPQYINSLVQGGPFHLKTKGVFGGYVKKVNLPFIFCSNFTFDTCYSSHIDTSTLKSRFLEVILDNPIDLDNVHVYSKSNPHPVLNEKDPINENDLL